MEILKEIPEKLAEHLKQRKTDMSQELGDINKNLTEQLERLLNMELELNMKEAGYITINDYLRRTDILNKIKKSVNNAVIDQHNRIYAAKIQAIKQQRENPVSVTKDQLREMFWSTYYRQNGRLFDIDQHNESTFNSLLLYFMNDPEFETFNPDFSLRKGICLVGGYGSGKTSMMRAFENNPKQHFQVVYSAHIFDHFKKAKSVETFTDPAQIPYVYDNFFRHPKSGCCIDDPGKEMNVGNYSENWNVIREILMRRYASKNSFEGLTHITTNLSGKDFAERYGGDIADRVKEMFNIIVMPDQPSRRK